jgi:hypothetical protein
MKPAQVQITKSGYILQGTIIKKYGPCGKDNCRCGRGKSHWHGPYYIWTRKDDGKTITQSLSATQAQFCKKAISNMQYLKTRIERRKQESLAALNNL